MDTLSHGLWAAVIAKALRKKKKINILATAWWGVFPDVFAFTLLFSWMFLQLFLGTIPLGSLPSPDSFEPSQHQASLLFSITSMLYSMSHSLVIFFLIFGLVFLVFRRPIWELSGWFMHIVMDIPTHSYQFYPTPFLWPILDWKFNGFSWLNPWFIVINYTAFFTIYFFFFRKKQK